jgi:hypothetical protein
LDKKGLERKYEKPKDEKDVINGRKTNTTAL